MSKQHTPGPWTDLLAAAEAMLIDVTDPREGVHRAPRTVYVDALRAAIATCKGEA